MLPNLKSGEFSSFNGMRKSNLLKCLLSTMYRYVLNVCFNSCHHMHACVPSHRCFEFDQFAKLAFATIGAGSLLGELLGQMGLLL